MDVRYYDEYLVSKQDEIRKRVLGKYGINHQELGIQPKRGRVKNEKAYLIAEVFGFNVDTLKKWRSEKCKQGRQRLYALLMSLPFDVLEHLKQMEIKE